MTLLEEYERKWDQVDPCDPRYSPEPKYKPPKDVWLDQELQFDNND